MKLQAPASLLFCSHQAGQKSTRYRSLELYFSRIPTFAYGCSPLWIQRKEGSIYQRFCFLTQNDLGTMKSYCTKYFLK